MRGLAEPRPLDRLDHRLAARRLRGRHVRAVGRALAERSRAHGALSCRSVFVGKRRSVHFAEPAAAASASVADDVLALARDLGARAPRLAEQLAAAYALAADDYVLLRRFEVFERSAPLVIALGGLVASGKSTVAKYVARRIGAPRVVADRVRRVLLAEADGGATHELALATDLADRVYAGLLARAGDVLASGRSVVLDACFPSEARRRAAAALAARYGARFVLVHCDAPEEDIAARLRLRDVRDGGPPGGWPKIARALEAQWEPPRRGEHVHLDTRLPRAAWLSALGIEREGRA